MVTCASSTTTRLTAWPGAVPRIAGEPCRGHRSGLAGHGAGTTTCCPAGKTNLVTAEAARLHDHLLAPLGVIVRSAALGQAIAGYRAARRAWEQRLHCKVSRAAERTVAPALP